MSRENILRREDGGIFEKTWPEGGGVGSKGGGRPLPHRDGKRGTEILLKRKSEGTKSPSRTVISRQIMSTLSRRGLCTP